MRFILLPILYLLLINTSVFSQRHGLDKKESYHTYVFQPTDSEIIRIFKEGESIINEQMLHTPIDTFLSTRSFSDLPPGNYLLMKAMDRFLNIEFYQRHYLIPHIHSTSQGLLIDINDLSGQRVSTAEVMIDKKKVKYNKKTKQFSISKIGNRRLLSIKYEGKTDYFKLKIHESPERKFNLGRIHHTKPIRYIWYPFRAVYLSVKNGYPYGWVNKVSNLFSTKGYNGFIAFNKPSYKKGDSIKVKTYLINKSGRPISKEVKVSLWNGKKNIILDSIKPYRKGAYSYQFKIHDSLDIKSNQFLNLTFSSKSGSLSNNFQYEQYELSKTSYSVSSQQKEYYQKEPIELTFRAKDDNGLPAFGTSAKVEITTTQVNELSQNQVLIPNQLFSKRIQLNDKGSAKLIIPDSIFQETSINFKVAVTFNDSENRTETKTLFLEYIYKPIKVEFKMVEDSVIIEAFNQGKPFQSKAILKLEFSDDDFTETEIQLPYKGPINPHALSYWVSLDSVNEYQEIIDWESLLVNNCFNQNEKAHFQVRNPRKIPFHYELYKQNKLIESGYETGNSDQFLLQKNQHGNATYFFHANYVWAGETRESKCRLDFYEKNLRVETEHPGVITPGQEVEIIVNVKNAKGKPVANADLTAYGFSTKFKYDNVPNLPYYGKVKRRKKRAQSVSIDEFIDFDKNLSLNHKTLKNKIGLDTIEYYRFLYPEKGFYKKEISLDDFHKTEFSAYFSQNGKAYKAQVIYLDGYPIYYKKTNETFPRYSFKTTSGTHSLKIRTANKLIIVDSVHFKAGFKTIINISNEVKGNNFQILDMPNKLTESEKRELCNYLIKINLTGKDDAVIQQGFKTQYLKNNYNSNVKEFLVGPFRPTEAEYKEPEKWFRKFEVEPGYSYYFEKELVKMTSYDSRGLLGHPISLRENNDNLGLKEQSLTIQDIQNIRENKWRNQRINYLNSRQTSKGNGEIRLQFKNNQFLKENLTNRIILLDEKNTDILRIYKANTWNFYDLPASSYRLIYVFENGYAEVKNLKTMADGTLYVKEAGLELKENDALMHETYRKVEVSELKLYLKKPAFKKSNVKILEKNYENPPVKGNLKGKVVTTLGKSISGVNVIIKGTNRGTITDINGYFGLNVSEGEMLQFSFIGLESIDAKVTDSGFIEVIMEEDLQQLNKVVVVGYGTSTKRNLTSPVTNVLHGMVAAVSTNNSSGTALPIYVRGTSSLANNNNNKPLYVVDGVLYDELPTSIDINTVQSVEVLRDAAASAIYGSRASTGAVIINTKSNTLASIRKTGINPIGHIRKNFHDDAFWQPKLTTNKKGKATFKTKFPDDITQWKMHFLVMGNKRRTGQSSSQIKTFKPVSAELIVPNFLLSGDHINLRGKIANYKLDSINVKSSFTINGHKETENYGVVKQFKIDSVSYSVPNNPNDSIAVTYEINYDQSKVDGEMRKIPVYASGTEEAKGFFQPLKLDSTYLFDEFPNKGADNDDEIIVTAMSNPTDMLLDNYVSLTGYAYNCNEQMATKLMAWFAQRNANNEKAIKPKNRAKIRTIIKELSKNINEESLWGWWGKSKTSWWISRHVLEALVTAEKEGFKINIPKEKIIVSLKYRLDNSQPAYMIYILEMLALLHVHDIKYDQYILAIKKDTSLTLNHAIRLAIVGKKSSLKIKLDSLLSLGKLNPFGGLWFGDDKRLIEDNDIVNSALMLKLLILSSKHTDKQAQIATYLLTKKNHHGWRNTYESITVLNQLMPYFNKNYKKGKSSLSIKQNKHSEVIEDFPFTRTYQNEPLEIKYKGGSQMFLTAYQKSWKKNPERVDSLIQVNTSLSKGQSLKQSIKTKLELTIKTAHTLNYVMVTVPIPAGCSIANQVSKWQLGADHVEYLYNQINIYYTQINRGDKTISFELIPRFSGEFQLNPAKVELMYFPTHFGREKLKKVTIQ